MLVHSKDQEFLWTEGIEGASFPQFCLIEGGSLQMEFHGVHVGGGFAVPCLTQVHFL